MNALARQVAILSALWAMCELLLPEGKHQAMVRMTASLLMMSALLGTVSGWLGRENDARPVLSMRIQQTSEETYQRAALTAMANQVRGCCVRMATRAGYQAEAVVYMTMDGALEKVLLTLNERDQPLISPEELRNALAARLGVGEQRVQLSVEDV